MFQKHQKNVDQKQWYSSASVFCGFFLEQQSFKHTDFSGNERERAKATIDMQSASVHTHAEFKTKWEMAAMHKKHSQFEEKGMWFSEPILHSIGVMRSPSKYQLAPQMLTHLKSECLIY